MEGIVMGSEWTVAELCALRHKAVEEYIRVGDDRESWQVDLRAVAVELDRALTQPGDPVSVETRAQQAMRSSGAATSNRPPLGLIHVQAIARRRVTSSAVVPGRRSTVGA